MNAVDTECVTPGLPRTSSALIFKIYRALAQCKENTCKTKFQMPYCSVCADPERQGSRSPLKNHKTTKPTFNVGASLVRPRNAIWMALRWQANDGPFFVVFESSLYSSTKKTLSELVLQCQGQYERSKVTCTEFFCFPLSASRQYFTKMSTFLRQVFRHPVSRPKFTTTYELWHGISNNAAFWQVQTQMSLLLLSLETPNHVWSVP